ncbi:hypothetical protein EJ05DRAFT_478133 [Pseudovirgaria hyperparasitica]|uniref:Cation efflux protein transmembrane domain-containing protein n=1 Tax=Pseudovirgaria hyperparasitica TaxID=470096 RepID=A0A6A6W4X2_9PEZI|nr:uncharacterized protein EJ05DRAFT_478133 [Pseudovirgaria hyperparasitica]KAF2756101.1 hypothetical protein EJ05DRAFT_478133 [Pseudovirgaria hyperparasitica]
MSSLEDHSTSPGLYRQRSHHGAVLKGYLPLSEDHAISTRGQHLPGLIQSRSSATISSLADRRPSRFHDEDLEAANETDNESVYIGHGRERRESSGWEALMAPQMRSQRLIGNSNPRYQWDQYWKSEEELKKCKKSVRKYYEHNNSLIQQFAYIDRLLDSSLPHTLIQEYQNNDYGLDIPPTISEESPASPNELSDSASFKASTNGSYGTTQTTPNNGPVNGASKVKRTAKNLYKVPSGEEAPLLSRVDSEPDSPTGMPDFEPEEDMDSGARIVTVAIYINLVANTILLILKIIVTIMTSSVSVLASLVDAALDFLSTAIVWTTTYLISRTDYYNYPVGRRRLEPIGVLVFSVVMVTSFVQVALEGIKRMNSGDHSIIQLTVPAIAIMSSTVIVKFACWIWCRLIKNSSVQALAQDAMTDVVFNIFSIIFPLVGYWLKVWWLDPLGGILLSVYVIVNWGSTTGEHIKNLTGAAADRDERNVLLYLTMRFAKTIKQIQGLNAYHAGDKLNVEVDIVLDENTALRDSHDLGESLQYVLESVPTVDRAFVHMDYKDWNLPTHMNQQAH